MRALFRENKQVMLFLVVANLLHAFGHNVWRAIFNNFAVERIGAGPDAIGLIQSVREFPGFLAFGVAILALAFTEKRIMAVSLALLGVGIVMTGQSTTTEFLLVSTLIMSLGFHYFNPGNRALMLMSMTKEQAPKAMGQLKSLGAIAAVLASGIVFFFAGVLTYEVLLGIVGGVVAVGGLVLFVMGRQGTHELPAKRKIRIRRRYWLFYTLTFLMGSRRHIFTTFAPFLLVDAFGVDVRLMAALILINNLGNIYVFQKVGKLVSRFGERAVLTVAFGLLVPVFLGYAYVAVLPLLCVLFVLDNVLFGFNLAIPTYLQKIAVSSDELTANLSLQETINHISAIAVPFLGGLVWVRYGVEALFMIGVGIAVVSLLLTQLMRTHDGDYSDRVVEGRG